MNKINKKKKSKLLAMALVLLLSSVMSYAPKAEAAKKAVNIPYASPWGMLYREPEYPSDYGRVWWQTLGNKNGGNIALESYYTYGSSVSVEHKYKASNGKYKTVKKTDSSYHNGSAVECVAGGSGKGKYTKFYAGAYGINFNYTKNY